MYVRGEEDKRVKEMERACVWVCVAVRITAGEGREREKVPEDFFQS